MLYSFMHNVFELENPVRVLKCLPLYPIQNWSKYAYWKFCIKYIYYFKFSLQSYRCVVSNRGTCERNILLNLDLIHNMTNFVTLKTGLSYN